MIKAVIIDDESDARFLLRNLIEKKFSDKIEIIGEADDVDSGITRIEELKPALVFLDIQMKSGTGFDLLKKIDAVNFEIIFITAYNEYAIEAFKFSAFGYLLKPIKKSELEEIIIKLEKQFKRDSQGADNRVKVLVENYGKKGEIQKIIISNTEGFKVLEISRILRLEGDRNYTHFILLEGRKITASKSIGEYEELLEEHGFIRIHQSTIVSLRHVTGFYKADGGFVEMSDTTTHKVSRSRKSEFLDRYS